MTSEATPWGARWSADIGRNLGKARRAVGLTGEQLAQKTKQIGHEVTRSVIANIETGRRETVTVQDIAVLAAALGVPPVVLLYDVSGPRVTALPGQEMDAIEAEEWWSGHHGAGIVRLDGDFKKSKKLQDEQLAALNAKRGLFQLERSFDKTTDEWFLAETNRQIMPGDERTAAEARIRTYAATETARTLIRMVDGDMSQLTERTRKSIGTMANLDPSLLDEAQGG
ncbi:MAG: helix-turn-helix domain-containing protein [Bifidobacteriaceae bacterium]|nr:helix-turn-helix domain-containing protein [Bifidobacteriaceae bacterium]